MDTVNASGAPPSGARVIASATSRGERHAPMRVALVNDFEIVLRGLEAMLMPFRDDLVVVELDVRTNPDRRIDVALLDTYGLPGYGADRVRSLASDAGVGAVAVYAWRLEPGQVEAVLAAGAGGALAKTMAGRDLADALLAIGSGERVVSPDFREPGARDWPGQSFGLTLRESEVAALLVRGLSNQEIAAALSISEHTVKTHLKAIFQKTGVASRGQAAARIAVDADFRRIRTVG